MSRQQRHCVSVYWYRQAGPNATRIERVRHRHRCTTNNHLCEETGRRGQRMCGSDGSQLFGFSNSGSRMAVSLAEPINLIMNCLLPMRRRTNATVNEADVPPSLLARALDSESLAAAYYRSKTPQTSCTPAQRQVRPAASSTLANNAAGLRSPFVRRNHH